MENQGILDGWGSGVGLRWMEDKWGEEVGVEEVTWAGGKGNVEWQRKAVTVKRRAVQ